jgi:hypothetical protein
MWVTPLLLPFLLSPLVVLTIYLPDLAWLTVVIGVMVFATATYSSVCALPYDLLMPPGLIRACARVLVWIASASFCMGFATVIVVLGGGMTLVFADAAGKKYVGAGLSPVPFYLLICTIVALGSAAGFFFVPKLTRKAIVHVLLEKANKQVVQTTAGPRSINVFDEPNTIERVVSMTDLYSVADSKGRAILWTVIVLLMHGNRGSP